MSHSVDRRFARPVAVHAAVASCVVGAAAVADSGAPRAPEPPLAEIVVTSGKIREPLSRVPMSVRVVTGTELERAGVLDFDDLPQIAPSLTISKTTQPANNSVNIRGIGTYAFSIAVEPSVGVVVDDVPLSIQAAAFTSLVDATQVEVLRGPQSTSFGRSAAAGVVRLTTAPVTSTFTGRVAALQTDDRERRVQATLSGPLTESVGFRVGANYSDYRGALFNVATGRWVNGQSDANVRVKLAWDPAGPWSALLTPFWTRTRGTCCAAAETYVPPSATTGSAATGAGRIPQGAFLGGIVPAGGNRRLRMDVDARGDARHAGGGLRVERRGERVTFLSLSSYEHYELEDRQDTDSTAVDFSRFQPASPPGGSANGGRFDVQTRTQEFRVQSSAIARLDLVGGLYWSRTRAVREFVRGSNSLDDYSLATPPGVVAIPVAPTNLPTTNDTSYSRYSARSTSESLAAFAQSAVRLTPMLELLAGVRWSRDRIDYAFFDRVNGIAFGSPRCSSLTPSGLAIRTCDVDRSVTGRVGLRAQPATDLMIFTTYARGHKGPAYDLSSTLTQRAPAAATSPRAGFPLADVVAASQPVPPERVDAWEIGARHTWLDGRALVSVTAFHMDYRGLQAQSRDLLLGQNLLNSVPRVTSSGLELEAAARAGAFTLDVAGAYDRTRIERFPNASCFRGQTAAEGCVRGVQDLSGKPLPNAPSWSLSVQGEYAVPMASGLEGFGTVAWRQQSSVNFSLLRDPAARQAGYGVVNLATGVRTDAWQLAVFANNVFDRRFALSAGRDAHINNPPGEFATSWRPARESERTLGLRGSYEF